MSARRLSPAMRTMLRNAIDGAPLDRGMHCGPAQQLQTQQALQARGMLDADQQPTEAGRAIFTAIPVPRSYMVWHLIGPQGCGKTTFADVAAGVISAMGGVSYHTEATEFAGHGGNPERIADICPGLTVLLIEGNVPRSDGMPMHHMWGDRVIDLTYYLYTRHPAAVTLALKLRLEHPQWSEARVLTQAKARATTREATC